MGIFSESAYQQDRNGQYYYQRLRGNQPSYETQGRTASSVSAATKAIVATTATAEGYKFSYYETAGSFGYNIYRNTTSDPNTATKINFVPSASTGVSGNQYNAGRAGFDTGFEDTATGGTTRTYVDVVGQGFTYYYWVAPVNAAGSEGSRVAMQSGAVSPSGLAGKLLLAIRSVTSSVTMQTSDCVMFCNATSASMMVNLPSASTVTGQFYAIVKTDASANTVTIDPFGAQTINGVASQVIAAQWEAYTIVSNGTGWVIV